MAVVAPLVLLALMFGWLIVTVAAIASLGAAAPADPDRLGATEHLGGTAGARNQILVVEVNGPILNDGTTSLFGVTTSGGYDIKRTLELAAADRDVKAVVLELNTPGGTVVGSGAIADGVLAVKKAGKPVIAHVNGLSASGGMWAMAPADEIVADRGSLIGSIGVIFGPFRQYTGVTAVDDGILFGGVETTGGVEEFYVTAGEGKDAGNPYRPLTAEERASFQAAVDALYGEFVQHVASNRGIPAETIRSQLGAYLFDSARAVEVGLADSVGSRQDAWQRAADRAGLASYDVRRPAPPGLFDSLFGVRIPFTGRPAPADTADLGDLCGTTPRAALFAGDLRSACASALAAATGR